MPGLSLSNLCLNLFKGAKIFILASRQSDYSRVFRYLRYEAKLEFLGLKGETRWSWMFNEVNGSAAAGIVSGCDGQLILFRTTLVVLQVQETRGRI